MWVALLFAFSINAQAGVLTLSGVVTVATDAFSALTPAGTPILGPISIADSAFGGTAGLADIESIDVSVGGFCFSTETPSACPLPGADVAITSLDADAIDLSSLPAGGTLAVTATTSAMFGMAPVAIMFDFGAGTFFADGGALGTVEGTVELVPIPAAVWLFGSAMLGLIGLRRRS